LELGRVPTRGVIFSRSVVQPALHLILEQRDVSSMPTQRAAPHRRNIPAPGNDIISKYGAPNVTGSRCPRRLRPQAGLDALHVSGILLESEAWSGTITSRICSFLQAGAGFAERVAAKLRKFRVPEIRQRWSHGQPVILGARRPALDGRTDATRLQTVWIGG
jgi:hypothetical protein